MNTENGNTKVSTTDEGDNTNSERVAIKIINKDRVKDVDGLEMVDREVALLIKLKHINIIRLIDVVQSASRLYIVTEFAPFELRTYVTQ